MAEPVCKPEYTFFDCWQGLHCIGHTFRAYAHCFAEPSSESYPPLAGCRSLPPCLIQHRQAHGIRIVFHVRWQQLLIRFWLSFAPASYLCRGRWVICITPYRFHSNVPLLASVRRHPVAEDRSFSDRSVCLSFDGWASPADLSMGPSPSPTHHQACHPPVLTPPPHSLADVPKDTCA